ncbi:hypothetical protein E7T09_15280 [Deinococcus sp. KSM4-11]|uniref:3-keto-5-aminohexanoate cleavage protein n=1 Tax=Deinococcus sp. KSM4-11 TaxID=2568654 RepID=UPI0010A2F13B|nr:3-keto-5-aminohexanoate cleavage protein [Deinococcus sp. KSM4-11]THF85872.1 hypothetical protein E7T09_15280 [Deinococcus sp. KSM4-11]
MLKACLNGPRNALRWPVVPVTPDALARESAASVRAGAEALHLHPRGPDGQESLAVADVAAALRAVRAACPGVPVGISSGYWMLPDVAAQLAAARDYAALGPVERPDFVSVNLHEPHALALAGVLLDAGIGVEAGLWTPAALAVFRDWPPRTQVLRVLVELPDQPEEMALPLADDLLRGLEGVVPGILVLLHGLDRSAWPLVQLAARRGLFTRIGLEDTLHLPDGSSAPGNAALVSAARDVLASAR